jgi:hypothetical protein
VDSIFSSVMVSVHRSGLVHMLVVALCTCS